MSADVGTRGPLAGVRIVAIEQYGAGPFGTLQLADLGADVIKIEDASAGGDISRAIPPGSVGDASLFFEAFNRNKRSICLDLKHPLGREVLERLVASADAVFSNLRGDQPRKLRLRHEDLAPINPRIVCVSVSGYGTDGDEALLPGYDAVIQAEAGWAALTGDPSGPPTKSGLSLVDFSAGLMAALGLLAGVIDARTNGQGRDVDINLLDSALGMITYPATWFLSMGIDSPRRAMSAHPSVVPFQFFRAADGFVAIACPKQHFFDALVDGLDLPLLREDPRFRTFTDRNHRRDELLSILSTRIGTETTAELLRRLRGRVPIGVVQELSEAVDPERLSRRGMLASYDHPALGRVRGVGLPIHVSGHKPTYRPGPALGGSQDEVLAGLGYSPDEVLHLAAGGAFGGPST